MSRAWPASAGTGSKGTTMLTRWGDDNSSAFGRNAEASGEGVMMQFSTAAATLEGSLQLPDRLTLGSQFINFYFGFNRPDGNPIVEAGVSLSTNQNYGPSPANPGYATGVIMGKSNTFQDRYNTQSETAGTFWNVFINDAHTHTASNFPASTDLRGKTLSVSLDLTGGAIKFRVQGMPVPSIPLRTLPPIGIAKMIAATDDASRSSFGAATMTMLQLGRTAPKPGMLWRVNGSKNSQRLTLDASSTFGFTCSGP